MATKTAGFSTPIDWFNQSGDKMVITGSQDGKSNQVAEAQNANGDVIARDVYNIKLSPSADYLIKGAISTLPKLGTVTEVTVDGSKVKVMLTSIIINTSNSALPTFSMSGTQVESSAATKRNYNLGTVDIKARAMAQDILKALSVTNADLNSASFNFSVNPVLGETADGVCASDVQKGVCECSFTFVQTGSTAPTFTAASGFTITAVPTATRNDGSYVEWTVTVTKDLVGSDTATTQS